jgi:hypothetical protein
MATAKKPSRPRKKASRMVKKAKLRARKTVRAAKRAGQKTRTAAKKAARTVKALKRPTGKPKRSAREVAVRTSETVGATLGKAVGTVEQAVSQVLPETKSTPE